MLMNHILGGGSFTSRLFEEVREKRGLAYSVGSAPGELRPRRALVISTATRSDRAAETLRVIRDEVKRMADEGVTAEELAAAKKYVDRRLRHQQSGLVIGRSPARWSDCRLDGLGIDYIAAARRPDQQASRLTRSQAAARKLLSAEPAMMVRRAGDHGWRQGMKRRPPRQRRDSSPSFAMAFGGGGARGLAHIHVIEALDELGIRPVAIAGSSIGAIMGAGMAAGMTGRDIHDYARSILAAAPRWRAACGGRGPAASASMVEGGFRVGQFNIERILKSFLPDAIPETFRRAENPAEGHGDRFLRPRAWRCSTSGDLYSALAASAAIPAVFRPVMRDGRLLIDGGIYNPVPFDLIERDADIVIAIDVVGAPVEAERKQPELAST